MEKYSKGTILFHWIHGAMIIFILLSASLKLSNMEDNIDKIPMLKIHMIFGLIVMILTIIRLIVLKKSKDVKPLDMSSFRQTIINLNHKLIYIVIFLVGISGVISAKSANLGQIIFFNSGDKLYTNLSSFAINVGTIHMVLSKVLIALIIMHIVGVVAYMLKNKENILKRII